MSFCNTLGINSGVKWEEQYIYCIQVYIHTFSVVCFCIQYVLNSSENICSIA